eukprot:365046-Chlamydomonas_euryale.AAC.1
MMPGPLITTLASKAPRTRSRFPPPPTRVMSNSKVDMADGRAAARQRVSAGRQGGDGGGGGGISGVVPTAAPEQATAPTASRAAAAPAATDAAVSGLGLDALDGNLLLHILVQLDPRDVRDAGQRTERSLPLPHPICPFFSCPRVRRAVGNAGACTPGLLRTSRRARACAQNAPSSRLRPDDRSSPQAFQLQCHRFLSRPLVFRELFRRRTRRGVEGREGARCGGESGRIQLLASALTRPPPRPLAALHPRPANDEQQPGARTHPPRAVALLARTVGRPRRRRDGWTAGCRVQGARVEGGGGDGGPKGRPWLHIRLRPGCRELCTYPAILMLLPVLLAGFMPLLEAMAS